MRDETTCAHRFNFISFYFSKKKSSSSSAHVMWYPLTFHLNVWWYRMKKKRIVMNQQNESTKVKIINRFYFYFELKCLSTLFSYYDFSSIYLFCWYIFSFFLNGVFYVGWNVVSDILSVTEIKYCKLVYGWDDFLTQEMSRSSPNLEM